MYGSFMSSSGKGASMMKLPLSETTGPALHTAMRSFAPGEPMRCRFCRIFLYAKGTTSIGMPCFHCEHAGSGGRGEAVSEAGKGGKGTGTLTLVPSTVEFLR